MQYRQKCFCSSHGKFLLQYYPPQRPLLPRSNSDTARFGERYPVAERFNKAWPADAIGTIQWDSESQKS